MRMFADNAKLTSEVTDFNADLRLSSCVHKPTPLTSEQAQDRMRAIDKATAFGVHHRSASQRRDDGSLLKDPVNFFHGLWYEGELCALYADTNVGKSILAIQVAEKVALLGKRTLYIDLELSDKGFEKRYGDHVFPDTLETLTFEMSKFYNGFPQAADDEGIGMLDFIEYHAKTTCCDVIILDNITALCPGLETGERAVRIVNRLLSMRNDNGWSILFVAHTPKLDKSQPITRDSMSGSKRLISLIDSAFAIGESTLQPGMRYIKQTKVRLSECIFHENNVLVCQIERHNGMLRFVAKGTAPERSLLAAPHTGVADRNAERVAELRKSGLSVRDIAQRLSLSRSAVHRMLSKTNS